MSPRNSSERPYNLEVMKNFRAENFSRKFQGQSKSRKKLGLKVLKIRPAPLLRLASPLKKPADPPMPESQVTVKGNKRAPSFYA